MRCMGLLVVLVIALSGEAWAQYARPVEVPQAVRPVAPAPNVVAPSPGVAAPITVPSAPTMTNPPTAVVPSPPPSMAQGGSARPRKCWCYIVNPATNSRQRSTCEINCCKGAIRMNGASRSFAVGGCDAEEERAEGEEEHPRNALARYARDARRKARVV